MKILLTGGSGFLGTILSEEFLRGGHSVKTISRQNADILCDLSEMEPDLSEEFFDVVIHCAGKAHALESTIAENDLFFKTNLLGTKNLSWSVQSKPPKAFVFISSVAVYGLDQGHDIDESFPLLGKTAYAQSKIQAEKFIEEWGEKFDVPVLILRLPLLAGKNAPGNMKKMINSMVKGKYFSIDGGRARRSMILASDLPQLILENIGSRGVYNLSDGYHPSFAELEELICSQLGCRKPVSIPASIARLIGQIGSLFELDFVNNFVVSKMVNDLTFSDKRARARLNWVPSKVIDNLIVR